MNKEESKESKEGIILPIICPKCGEKIELLINFDLLPPKNNQNKNDIIKED